MLPASTPLLEAFLFAGSCLVQALQSLVGITMSIVEHLVDTKAWW